MPVNRLKFLIGSKYPFAFEWFKYLSEQAVTEIICWNLIRDFDSKTKSCPRNVSDCFLKALDNLFSSDQSLMQLEPKWIFRRLREKLSKYVCLKGPLIVGDKDNMDCCFKVMSGSTCASNLCRVMKLDRFMEYCKNRRPIYLENPSEGVHDIKADLNINSRRGFLFVTKKDKLQVLMGEKPIEKDWKRVLEVLGLTNIGNDKNGKKKTEYVLVIYPETFAPARLCQPTFVEGGERSEFCDQPLSNGWNQTVDLGDSSLGDPGVPEAVHSPFGLAEVQYQKFAVSHSCAPDYKRLCEAIRKGYD